MSTVEASIRLGVPLGEAYDALQDLSLLPVLVSGIDDARALPHATLITFRGQDWEMQVVDEAPGRHITWDRLDGQGSAEIRFRPAGPRGTKLTLLLYDVDDESAVQAAAERELARLQQAIVSLTTPPATTWGVAGPW